ncbi:Uu.00g075430.m01.CDS01 [Anthostomella pinea]|uniref:cutinase n=1 Tax=Anthostomella pinea TaxID=933095 RepID=A0AAI8VVQ2_9PEZI|nr:Uu.00g075430.m01.CDS01 [Anthostomella pinea]
MALQKSASSFLKLLRKSNHLATLEEDDCHQISQVHRLALAIKMKFSISLLAAALAVTTTASPIALDVTEGDVLSRRAVGTTANEFLDSGCKDLIFIYARGTGQSGNLGEMPGPAVANGLKSALGTNSVAAQGVTYAAAQASNLLAGGCKASEAKTMAALITQAATQCPQAAIAVAGYSLGAPMVHRSVEQLTTAVKARVGAAVTFGDTQNAQDGDRIPGFDTGKTLILCNTGDRVCDGTLQITSAHLDYSGKVDDAVDFIVSKV